MTTTKVNKPKCDGCGKDRWFLAHCADRRLCEECFDDYEAKRTKEDATVPDEPEEENASDYPTPWKFDSESFVIDRHTSDGDGEIAMVFTTDGVPESELLVLILAVMNGWST